MNGVRPICFMVMPFGRKKTDAGTDQIPGEINFDALWDKALRPVLIKLGYEPVRADQDVGALIVHEMLERLYFSDLVLADMTIPNGNVYYELGIRHASKIRSCVMVAADWSRQLFDVMQMRTVRYPLPEGEITDATAEAIAAAITAKIGPLALGDSPMYEVLPGFPTQVDATRARSFRTMVDALAAFQAKASAVRMAPKAQRREKALALVSEYSTPPLVPAIAHGLLRLLEHCGEWQAILDLCAKLPADVTADPKVVELSNLAQSKAGDHLQAIGGLEALIASAGSTSEREGLIGGRYKRLHDETADPADKERYLNAAIKHYERGMMQDLNDFYPSSNLPRLYRLRALPDDEARAQTTSQLVYFACRRTKEREPNHPWVRPTLLGAAFDAGNVEAAQALYGDIVAEGAVAWQLATTLKDLNLSLARVDDPVRKLALQQIYDRLARLV